MDNNSKLRSSNFELLRLFLIIFVIVLHYNGYVCKVLELTENSSFLNKYIVRLGESFSICAVNTFIIISGYFLYQKNSTSTKKIITIFIPVICYSAFIYLIKIILGINSFSFHSFFGAFIPHNYYAWFYCVIVLLSPYLNIILYKLDKKSLIKFMILLFIIFSIIPTLEDFLCEKLNITVAGLSPISGSGNEAGYTLINFILLYYVGATIKLLELSFSKKISFCLYTLLSLCILLGHRINPQHIHDYCNIIVIIQSIFLFLFFQDITISNKIINFLSKSVWGVFIIHNTVLEYLSGYIDLKSICEGNFANFIIYSISLILSTFIISIILDKIFTLILKPVNFLLGLINYPVINFIDKDNKEELL